MEIKWDNAPPSVCDMWADSVEAPLQQRYMYGLVCSELGRRVRRASIPNRAGDHTICQFVSRRAMGFELILGLRAHLSTNASATLCHAVPTRSVLAISPETGPPATAYKPVVSPQTSAALSLRQNTDDMRARMHQKWRNRLNFGTSQGLDIRHVACDRKTLLVLLDLEARQQRQRKYRGIPAIFTGAWHEIAPDTVRLFSARKNGDVVATMVFLRHGNTATYHMGWANDHGRRTSAHHVLMWRAMCDLRDDGVRSIDLGMINTHDTAGLARFKLGTGAIAHRGGATYVTLPVASGINLPSLRDRLTLFQGRHNQSQK